MDALPTSCRDCSRNRLRKIDAAAARVSESLLRAAEAGDLMRIFLILRDLGEGRIPPEVKGEVRSDAETLSYEKFCEVWEGVYRVSEDDTQRMMQKLRPLLEWQLGFRNTA